MMSAAVQYKQSDGSGKLAMKNKVPFFVDFPVMSLLVIEH